MYHFILYIYVVYTAVQKFGISKTFLKERNYYLIKSGSNGIYNVTIDFCF